MANEVQGPGNYRTGDYPKEPPEIPDLRDLESPTTTSRLEALMDHEYFPLMLSAAETLFGTLYDFFTTSPLEELVEEQLDWGQLQKMRASGVFSEEDIAQIQSGARPMVNRVAGNVGSRGLGGSVSGAAIVAQAQAAPFHKLQAQAAQLYQDSLIHASKFVLQLSGENAAYARSFGFITKLYEAMRKEQKKNGDEEKENGDGEKENVQVAVEPMLADFDERTRRFMSLMEELA